MPNITGASVFSDVPLVETSDYVLGGLLGTEPANKQAKALADRTEWLKNRTSAYDGIREITVSADATITLDELDAGKLIIININSNLYATLTLILPSGTAGKKIGIYVSDKDTSICKVVIGSNLLFNNEFAELTSDGIGAWKYIPITLSQKQKSILTSNESIDSTHTRLRLACVSSYYYGNDLGAISSKSISEIKFIGDFEPRQDTRIKIFLPIGVKLINDGNIAFTTPETQIKTNYPCCINLVWNRQGSGSFWSLESIERLPPLPLVMDYNTFTGSALYYTGTGSLSVKFPTVGVDTIGCYDTTTGVFTPNVEGYYQITVGLSVCPIAISSNTEFDVHLQKNSSGSVLLPTKNILFVSDGISDGFVNKYKSVSVTKTIYFNGTTDHVGVIYSQYSDDSATQVQIQGNIAIAKV